MGGVAYVLVELIIRFGDLFMAFVWRYVPCDWQEDRNVYYDIYSSLLLLLIADTVILIMIAVICAAGINAGFAEGLDYLSHSGEILRKTPKMITVLGSGLLAYIFQFMCV